jgi:serine acetyltransferase
MQQLIYFSQDIKRMLGKKKYRLLILVCTRSFWGILGYRIDRMLFLLLGKAYPILRLPLYPFFMLTQSWSNIDIHYKAAIKGGLLVLHPALGVVVSGRAKIGEGLTLTGGNVIGIKKDFTVEPFVIGDNCTLGANAVVLGPLELGNQITIGALACVINTVAQSNVVLAGVPSKIL